MAARFPVKASAFCIWFNILWWYKTEQLILRTLYCHLVVGDRASLGLNEANTLESNLILIYSHPMQSFLHTQKMSEMPM